MRQRLAQLKMNCNSPDNLSAAYHDNMNRRALLRELIDRKYGGNVAAFARAIKKSPSQVHQWLSGHRAIGDGGARHIERTVPGLWQGYFDGESKPPWLENDHLAKEPSAPYNVEHGPDIRGRIPLISWTTAGDWGEVVDNFQPGDAEDWIATTAKVGPHAFALRIRGESMMPTIPDGAIVIVDPDSEPHHRSIVIVRQNQDSEATCKRLIYEGDTPMIRPDNPAYANQIAPLAPDARIVGVVRQVVVDLE